MLTGGSMVIPTVLELSVEKRRLSTVLEESREGNSPLRRADEGPKKLSCSRSKGGGTCPPGSLSGITTISGVYML